MYNRRYSSRPTYGRRSYGAPRRPSYGRSMYGRRTYGRSSYSQARRPSYGARAGFARRRMTRRFTVGGSRW
jgi:hypothetical protein